jgi:hypothetical protein
MVSICLSIEEEEEEEEEEEKKKKSWITTQARCFMRVITYHCPLSKEFAFESIQASVCSLYSSLHSSLITYSLNVLGGEASERSCPASSEQPLPINTIPKQCLPKSHAFKLKTPFSHLCLTDVPISPGGRRLLDSRRGRSQVSLSLFEQCRVVSIFHTAIQSLKSGHL